MTVPQPPLDDAVSAALADLRARRVPSPEVLLLLGTGVGLLGAGLVEHASRPLGRTDGVPAAWRDATLHHGRLGGVRVWLLEDAPGLAEHGNLPEPGEEPWERGFPVWLAAAAGAVLLVHTSGALALPVAVETPDGIDAAEGELVLAEDHVNLSGGTPLVGLGGSRLGPLFPDQTYLHHAGLREAALARCRAAGIPASTGVVACTAGPALETPAERRWLARTGARVAVQGLAAPLLAAAHAGLEVLAVAAVTDTGEALEDMRGVVARVERLAPALEELLSALAPDLRHAADQLGVEAP